MKTQDEIVQRVEAIKDRDLLGFGRDALLYLLDFEHVKSYLKEGITEEEWNEGRFPGPLDYIKDYMPFALGKAEDHRGISASRSVEKMREWLWALGDEELVNFASSSSNYSQYGVPILRAICEKYDIPMPAGKTWFDNMSQGLPCYEGCDMGCGR